MRPGQIVVEVADELHHQTKVLPNPKYLNSINEFLVPLQHILRRVVHTSSSLKQIKIKENQFEKNPADYQKLIEHLNNLNKHPGLLRQHINEDNKANYRAILQWLGGYLVKTVDPGIWYKEILRRIQQAEKQNYILCVIVGLRFPTDEQLVHQAQGIVIDIERPNLGVTDISDPTERERKKIKHDSSIINDSTLKALSVCTKQVLKDIKEGELKKRYRASSFRAL